MQKQMTLGQADSICDLRTRKTKNTFFTQTNNLLDWGAISAVIPSHYKKGKSVTGKPGYDGLLLFKMCLLQAWHGLSDHEVEDRVNDSISFGCFCGLAIDQVAPDHSALSRFRSAVGKTGAFELLFKEVNVQLSAHKIIAKTGAIVDASVIEAPLRPKGKANHEVTRDREGEQEVSVGKTCPSSVDTDAPWLKERGKYHFGYKKHIVTDEEGLALGVATTKASVNETGNLPDVLDAAGLPGHIALKADKGHQSEKNAHILKERKPKNHILKKARENKALAKWELRFNKLVGKTRFKVGRTFGGIKLWSNGGVARYRGIEKMHGQNLIGPLCHNLYRSPGIIASNQQK